MVYIEYNNSKRISVDYEIEVTESNSHEGYTLLPFSPFVSVYPNASRYPIQSLQNEENDEYLLRLIVGKTIPYGNYYFEYDNKYYLFTAELKSGITLYFKMEEFLPEESEEWVLMPVLNVKGYTQMKTVLPVYDELEINQSGNEMTFSTVKADYGIRDKQYLPMALQEMRIWQGELIGDSDLSMCKLIYTGFLDRAEISQKYNSDDECDIEFSLLSPMNMATRRYVAIVGTYEIADLFFRIFEPLINDGFELNDIRVDNKKVAVNYYLETIETIMNDLSSKLNVFWLIDSNKNIHIIDVIKLLGQEPKMIINEDSRIEGLYKLLPIIENNDYFNCVNIKNARVFTRAVNSDVLEIMKVVDGSVMQFKNPIDFGVNGCQRVCDENLTDSCTVLYIKIGSQTYNIQYDYGDTEITLPAGVVWNDEDTENASLILERDTFFKNLVVGFQWMGSSQNVTRVETDKMLKYEMFRLTNSTEVNKCAELLTNSGIIEKTIDVNESWFTKYELIEYCNNLIKANTNNTATVEISLDKNYDLKIGDTIRINRPSFFIEGDFVITEITEKKSHYDSYDCQIVAKNNKLQDSYIDIFRKEMKEEYEEKYSRLNVIEYISEEVVESYGIYDDIIPEVEDY